MKQFFLQTRFAADSKRVLERAIGVAESYGAQGYRLSLRQLYYQLVAANVVPNTEKSYKRVGELLSKARLAGEVDWDLIQDRTRETVTPSHWESPREILECAAESFRVDKWADQPNHVEVMVAKDALVGVLGPVCAELDVPLTANRDYSSDSMMYEVGARLQDRFRARMGRLGHLPAEFQDVRTLNYVNEYVADRLAESLEAPATGNDGAPLLSWDEHEASRHQLPRIVILYLGDHDPSGIDMTRDVHERLALFADRIPLEVHRLALNMQQIRELRPPPQPAKIDDSRAGSYIARFGRQSWELDAVRPDALAALVRNAVDKLRDRPLWDAAVKRERAFRDRLAKIAGQF